MPDIQQQYNIIYNTIIPTLTVHIPTLTVHVRSSESEPGKEPWSREGSESESLWLARGFDQSASVSSDSKSIKNKIREANSLDKEL